MTKRGRKFVDKVNEVDLDPELLMGAMVAISELKPGDRQSFEGRTFAIAKYLAAQSLPDARRRDAVLAVGFRFEALAKLEVINAEGWRLPGRDGADWLHTDVVRCAAMEPLVQTGEDIRFDADSFHRRLLGIATPAGLA